MKSGTAYAGRLKKAYAKHRGTVSIPEVPEPVDPLRSLAVAIVGVGGSERRAEQAIDNMLSSMVDWNEIRVSSPPEVFEAMADAIPNGLKLCEQLIAALHAIYDQENRLSLDRLRDLGRREARQFLEQLNGVDAYAVAAVLLWSLGGHGIPVNDRLLVALHDADLVHSGASRAEVQAFLERHINAAEAKEFCLVMRSFKAPKRSPKKIRKSVTKKTKKKSAT